jgi:hypothetical protein
LQLDQTNAEIERMKNQEIMQGKVNLLEDTFIVSMTKALLNWFSMLGVNANVFYNYGNTGGSGGGGGMGHIPGVKPAVPEAAGGILSPMNSGINEVGEQGTEGIVNGRVVPHSEWMNIRQAYGFFQPIQSPMPSGISVIPAASSSAQSRGPITINLSIGDKKLKTLVLDIIGDVVDARI